MNILDLFDLPADEGRKEYAKLPEGTYQVEIEEAKIDEANQYGPRLAYTLKITEEGQYKNRKLWPARKLESHLMWKIRQDLDALGLSDVKSADVSSALESLIGKVVVVEVAYADNKNNPEKPYMNVEFMDVPRDQLPF